MQDRGYIKWAPFNSIINDKKIFYEVLDREKKCNKPILSEDQIDLLNDKIFEAFTNHIKIKLYFFKDSNIIELIGYINNINTSKKYITFNKTHIFFNQIVNILNFY